MSYWHPGGQKGQFQANSGTNRDMVTIPRCFYMEKMNPDKNPDKMSEFAGNGTGNPANPPAISAGGW